MDKFDMVDELLYSMDAETLLNELVRAMPEQDAQENLRWVAQCWGVNLDDDEEEDED